MTGMQSYRITEEESDPVTMRIFVAASDEEAAVVAQKYADEESEAEWVSLHRTNLTYQPVLVGRFTRSE